MQNNMKYIICFTTLMFVSCGIYNSNHNNISNQLIQKKVSEHFDTYAKLYKYNGVVLVAKDSRIILNKAYGVSNPHKKQSLQTDMRFFTGSTTKMLVATAILKLVEMDKLKLNDSVGKFITLPKHVAGLTIHQLLSHTSGLATLPNFEGSKENVPGPVEKYDFVKSFTKKPLRFKPESKYEYSNSAYYLLGVLIEKITHQTVFDFLNDNFFTKAGIKNTFLPESGTVKTIRASTEKPAIAMGMVRKKNRLFDQNNNTHDASVIYTAGITVSTSQDMLKWSQNLYDGKFLNNSILNKMLTNYTSDYCYGLFKGFLPNKMIFYGHNGGMIGNHALMIYVPSTKTHIILISNIANQCFDLIVQDLAMIISGEVVSKPEFVHLDYKKYNEFTGEYNGEYFGEVTLTIFSKKNKLYCQKRKQISQMKYLGNDRFYIDGFRSSYSFKRDQKGTIVSLANRNDGLSELYILKKLK
ncbi:MAG: beta-lactamase family protein [Deltaproteobacteria bacterium]|nr:beta-lactamase family protein [Deltaproteobacteria bacterium]